MSLIIEKRNCNRIYGLTHEQEQQLKEYLTYPNPAYEKAKRYSKNRYISIPPYLTYYNTGKNALGEKYFECPIGVDIFKILDYKFNDRDTLRWESHIFKVGYPSFVLELRNQQKEARDAYLESVWNPKFNAPSIISLPTGKGKTILALYIAAALRIKTLVLVHKDDLVTGWKKDIDLCFGGELKAGLIKAKSRTVGEQITIATVQTLSRMDEKELSEYTEQFGLVIQDECLVGNTLVVQSDGGVSKIEKCHTFTRVLGGDVSEPFKKESEIWSLGCRHGVIKCSPTHPTWYVEKKSNRKYSMSDFKYAPVNEIPNNVYIPVRINIPHVEKHSISLKLAKFLALVLCNGATYYEDGRVDVTIKDRELSYCARIFIDGCNEFNANFEFINHYRNKTVTLRAKSATLTQYFKNAGIPKGDLLTTSEIPEFFYSVQIESIKAFIETCFNLSGKLKVINRRHRIIFDTCSETFANGLSLILRKFGIVPNYKIRHGCGKKYNDNYQLSIGDNFFNTFADTFNLEFPIIERNDEDTRKFQDIIVGDYLLSEIKWVNPLGYKDIVYDFTVSESHSFIANGVLTHNCHHVGLNIFNIINKFNSRYKLGLSATPTRSDGLNFVFDLFFGGICYKYKAGQDDEDISNVVVHVLDSNFKYRPFVYDGQVFNYYDFKKDELPDKITFLDTIPYKDRPMVSFHTIDNLAVMANSTCVMVCRKILYHYRKGHSCLVLFTQKEHINHYFRYLRLYMPESQILLYYGDSKEKSDVLIEKAESKEALVTLATFAKTTEGTNVKAWEVEFLVSSMNDRKNVEQATGRVRRRKEGKLDPVIVYDIRYSNCYSLAGHYSKTRKEVYDELGYKIEDVEVIKKHSVMFSRGYNVDKHTML